MQIDECVHTADANYIETLWYSFQSDNDWGMPSSDDDDWANSDSSFFSDDILPSCDLVDSPDVPCSNGTGKPEEKRYRDPVISRLISQVR